MCDDSESVLMIPPPLSHYCLDGKKTDGKVGKYCGDGLLGCRDDEVRVIYVGGEGRTN